MAAPTQVEMSSAFLSGGLSCLQHCDEIQVKERFNVFEATLGMLMHNSDTKSRYRIFGGPPESIHGDEIFFGVETAGRRLWPVQAFLPDCAPWNIDIYLTENRDSITPGESSFSLRRPCTLTCCCFGRPVVDVTDVDTGVRIGSIREPFTCSNFKFTIQDADDNTVMRVGSDSLSWGLCCPYPCGPCATVDLSVEQTRTRSRGHIQKKMPQCWNPLLWKEHQDSSYRVDFGDIQAPEDKALLMSLALLIDFKYFHMPNSDNEAEWQWL